MGRIKKSYLISSKVKFCLRRLRLRRGGSFCFGEVQVLSRRHLEHGRSRVRRMSKQVLLGRRRWSPVRSDISKKLIIVHYVQGFPRGSFACAEQLQSECFGQMSEHSFPGRRSRIRGANVVWVSEVVGGRSGITRAVGVNPMLLHQDAFASVSTCNRSNETALGMKWLALFQPFKIV